MPDPVATPVATPAAPAPRVRIGAEIAGLGIALPETVVSNAPIAERLGIDENWIVTRTGIHERRIIEPGERVYEFAARAGAAALADAGVEATALDLIIVATTTNEDLLPAVAARVGAELGAKGAGAFDLAAACTGFVSAVSVATGLIESGRAGAILVVGADLMSTITDPDDRPTAAVFADGAGAVLVRSSPGEGRIGPVVLGTDGNEAELIYVTGQERLIRMKGHETFRYAVDRMSEATEQALAAAGLGLDDADLFIYHQANARILRAVGERLGLPEQKVVDCIGKLGNTSAATIPLALAEARREGRLEPGSRVLLAAFGAGLSWGATVVEWGSA